MLKSPTTSLCGSICSLSFSNVSFTYLSALVFGVLDIQD